MKTLLPMLSHRRQDSQSQVVKTVLPSTRRKWQVSHIKAIYDVL